MTEIKLRTKLSAYAKGVIPTKVSQLEQDIDYTTEAPKDDKIYARKNGEWENISTEQDSKLYVRQNDEWKNISTPNNNQSYVRKNDEWIDLGEELQRKTYRTHQQITEEIDNKIDTTKQWADEKFVDNNELESRIDAYDTEIKNHVSQNYVNNTTFNTYKNQAEAKFIDGTELASELSNYVTTTELNSRDYVADIPTANNKVYARKRGQWEELDLDNMGAINIETPVNSGLISQEIPKEESHEARNKYRIEMNKWEGNLEDVPNQLETGKFYYAVDPESEDTLLDGGTSQTNDFDETVDILTTRFQLRTDTKLNWETYNPVLGYGEPGWEIDTYKLKIGDGVTPWNDLGYQSGDNLNKEVLTNLTIQSNGDNLALNREYTNLQTDVKTYSPVAVPLVDSEKAGLMSTADYMALQDVISRVDDLEGKTTRLLYLNTPVTQDIEITIDSVLESGSIVKEGSIINGVEIDTDTTLIIDTDLFVGDLIKTGSTIANSSLINNTQYPNKNTINSFVIGEGYTSPFEGIAVVVNGTYHIWHYYENDNVGWKDDGLDTVSNFTNETAGVILGSQQVGKVFAENDGTGSVVGWDNLTNRVGTNESSINGINQNISTIQEDIGLLQTDVNSIQGNITNIQTNVLGLQGAIDTLQSDIGQVQDDISSIDQDITNIQSNIGTMQTSIGNLENNVTAIQNAKVNEITEQSTNSTYPSTAAVYDFVTNYTPDIESLTNAEIDEMWADENSETPIVDPIVDPVIEEGVIEISSNDYDVEIESDGGQVYNIRSEDYGILNINSENYTITQESDGGQVFNITTEENGNEENNGNIEDIEDEEIYESGTPIKASNSSKINTFANTLSGSELFNAMSSYLQGKYSGVEISENGDYVRYWGTNNYGWQLVIYDTYNEARQNYELITSPEYIEQYTINNSEYVFKKGKVLFGEFMLKGE